MNRRGFLLSASAAAISAAMPLQSLAAPLAAVAAPKAPLLAFVVGTPGEYDWQTIWARSAEGAFKAWAGEQDEDDDEIVFDEEYVQRVPAWDALKDSEITPAHWFAANMGHICDRCGTETHPDFGGLAVGSTVVCEECATFADQVIGDPERAVELLADRIFDDGENVVRDWLIENGDWAAVEPVLWAKALAEAAA